jgi:HlyD family secretion protein
MTDGEEKTGKKPRSIFRAEALDQLSSPEQLEQLLQVTNRKSWITLATVGFLVLATLLWSIFGRIPVTVGGNGILIYPRQVMPFQASTEGQLASMNIAVGDRVQAGQVIATISVPDIAQRLEQEYSRLERMEVRHETLVELQQKRLSLETEALQRKRQVLGERITSAKAMAKALRTKNETYIAKQYTVIHDYLAAQAELEQTLEKRYQSFKRLLDSQLASEEMVLQAYQKLIDVRIKKSDLELEAQQLELKRLETEEAYAEQQQRIAELTTQLQEISIDETRLKQKDFEEAAELDIQIQETLRSIARLEKTLKKGGEIVNAHDGIVLEIGAIPGEIVRAGETLGFIEAEDAASVLMAVGFFNVGDGKKIQKGMSVNVTPSTVKRQRHGSITGIVSEVSAFPVSTDSVAAVVGNHEAASQLTQSQPRIQVYTRLTLDEKTPSGYKWTSGEGPDMAITSGTTAEVRATVRYFRPISYVIPVLRKWAGVH